MQTTRTRPKDMEIIEEDLTVEGFVCRDVEGPFKPHLTEDGLHVPGMLLCTEKQREECAFLDWGHCRRVRIKIEFSKTTKKSKPKD